MHDENWFVYPRTGSQNWVPELHRELGRELFPFVRNYFARSREVNSTFDYAKVSLEFFAFLQPTVVSYGKPLIYA